MRFLFFFNILVCCFNKYNLFSGIKVQNALFKKSFDATKENFAKVKYYSESVYEYVEV